MSTARIPARELPGHIGASVTGHGKLTMAALVQPGGDIVVAQFGEGFGRREATFRPDELVEVTA